MLCTRSPSRPISAANSRGCGKSRMERSRYSYSSLPEPWVASQPMKGTTWVMNPLAMRDSKLCPEGSENSSMQTRLDSLLRKARRISRSAFARSGTFRIPNDMEILSMLPVATPSLGFESRPCASIAWIVDKFCASPFTRCTMPVMTRSSTFSTPRRSISVLGSTPSTAPAETPPLRSLSWARRAATSSETSAVPVARSSTRSSLLRLMHSWTKVCRQCWSRPSDIHLFVLS
mmetsp:Transcript_130443/g.354013  ORF Transcript_130443/g.354013 Transcript_130443/m.354013 type:complete len:232 (-) Transcript_130443:334-1029(-)